MSVAYSPCDHIRKMLLQPSVQKTGLGSSKEVLSTAPGSRNFAGDVLSWVCQRIAIECSWFHANTRDFKSKYVEGWKGTMFDVRLPGDGFCSYRIQSGCARWIWWVNEFDTSCCGHRSKTHLQTLSFLEALEAISANWDAALLLMGWVKHSKTMKCGIPL